MFRFLTEMLPPHFAYRPPISLIVRKGFVTYCTCMYDLVLGTVAGNFCRIFLQIFPFIFLCIGCTPLILAATAGHASTVEILLDNGADIEAQSDRTKDTALSLACSGGRQEVCDTCTCIWNCYK